MRSISILAFILFCNLAKAEDFVKCENYENKNSIEEKINSLEAPLLINCNNQLKNDADDEYSANFKNLPKKTAIIKGLKLSGSSDELNFIKKMLGENPSHNWNKAKACGDVLCALSAIYDSKEAAQRTLNIAKKHGYIVSASREFINEKDESVGELFSLEEIRTIDLAYKQLPPTFKKLRSLDRLKRMPRGLTSTRSPNAAAYASPGYKSSYYSLDGEIVFIDSAFTENDNWSALVAIHELVHHVDFSKSDKTSFGISEGLAFMKLSGWKKSVRYETNKKGQKTQIESWEHEKDKKFVTDYASTQPAEDLAESATFYVLEPQKLKNIDPEKYNFIKNNIFGGKEYLNSPDLQMNSDEILAKCLENTKEVTFYSSRSFFSEIRQKCLDKFMEDLKIVDPALCNYSKGQIKAHLYDKIAMTIDGINHSIKNCSEKLELHRAKCMNEDNDFRKTCAIEQCQVHELVKPKLKDETYLDRTSKAFDTLKKKVGTTNIVTQLLNSSFNEKISVSSGFSLYQHKSFLDRAVPALGKLLADNNFKFDTNESLDSKAQSFIMLDKDITKALDSFQKNVLKPEEKSQEKNLELIRNWAKNQGLEDTANFDNLAETVTKHNKGKGWFGR